MATTWTIAIDWDRDGEFSGDDIVTERTVWVNWFLGFREPYKDIAENSVLGLVLDNRDRRFSPENEDTANPLAGKIQPLRPVRVTSNDGTTTRTHWSGWVESVHPAANKYGERLVKISVHWGATVPFLDRRPRSSCKKTSAATRSSTR